MPFLAIALAAIPLSLLRPDRSNAAHPALAALVTVVAFVGAVVPQRRDELRAALVVPPGRDQTVVAWLAVQ